MTQKEYEQLPEDIKKIIPILKEMTHDQKEKVLELVKDMNNWQRDYDEEEYVYEKRGVRSL